MRVWATALAALVAVSTIDVAAAECYSTSAPEATLAPGSTFYLDIDVLVNLPGRVTALWLYEETNDRPGLQRGDPIHSDVYGCEGAVPADQLVYGAPYP